MGYNFILKMFMFEMMPMQPVPHHARHHHTSPFAMPMLNFTKVGEMVGIELEDAAKFAKGFVDEFSTLNGLHALKDCVSSFDTVEDQLQEIVNDFKSLNPVKMIDGAKDLVHLLTDLPGDLKTCEAIQGDVTKITSWGENVVTHPTQVISNVMSNIGDIMTEVPKVMSDSSAGNYTLAGDDTAHVVVDVFGKVDTKFKEEPDLALLLGA